MNIKKGYNLNGTFLVAQGTKIVELECFGFADKDKRIKCSPNTQYLLGSVTKHITATAILTALYDYYFSPHIFGKQLADDTKNIDTLLNQPITAYLSKNHMAWENAVPDWAEKITIHNLLTHTSGIDDYMGDKKFRKRFANPPHISDIFRYIKEKSLLFEPGTKHVYCTAGYIILGEIIKQITGKDIHQYIHERFFEPLQMNATRLLKPCDQFDQIEMLAKGYEFDITAANPCLNAVKPYWMFCSATAGGVISTALDMMKWKHALFSAKIIPAPILNRMLFEHVNIDNNKSYGYGLYIKNDDILGRYYYHTGGNDGFRCIIRYFPLDDIFIAFFSNVSPDWTIAHNKIEEIESQAQNKSDCKDRFRKINMLLEASFPHFESNRKKYNLNRIADDILDALKMDKDMS